MCPRCLRKYFRIIFDILKILRYLFILLLATLTVGGSVSFQTFKQINGILFPGGSANLSLESAYMKTARKLFNVSTYD